MSDILCLYYSRTGTTRKAATRIAQELGAELYRLTDGVDRSGWRGCLRCGMDAVRTTPPKVRAVRTRKPLSAYRLVILGTPVWAGRCSCVMRSFLKEYGADLWDTAHVIVRGTDLRASEVFDQMDLYTRRRRHLEVSLRPGSVGYEFWLEDFIHRTYAFLGST